MGRLRTDVMRLLCSTLAVFAVSCDAAVAARTPVQVVEIAPAPERRAATIGAQAAPQAVYPSSAPFPRACRASAPESKNAETTARVNLPFGSLSLRVMPAAHSDDDVCLAMLTDARGTLIDCKIFADEGCDLEAPVASAGRVTVEGVCITERCGVAPQRARRIFEVVASATSIEVRAVTGDIVQECAGDPVEE